MEHECGRCGFLMEPKGNFFISEIDSDLMYRCPACSQVYDIEHECYEDFCTEVLYIVNES